jgi:diaminopimelate decarboxylase
VKPIPEQLLPETAVLSETSTSLGGVDLVDLAETFGTPIFVYDEAEIRSRSREAVNAFGDGVAYASKAFLCQAMARLVHEEGMWIDVSTAGELHVAMSAGVPASRLVMHGNNKSDDEIGRALDARVGRLVVDSFDEIDRIERLAAGWAPTVLVRVTPGVEAHTHEYVATGLDDSKFGFGLASGAAAEAVDRLRAIGAVRLAGIHAHIGSQVFRVDSFVKEVEALAGFFAPLGLPELCVGGGLGVAYVEGESAPTLSEWAAAVQSAARGAGIPDDVRLTAEPGRAIVARAAVTLYRVGTIKELSGIGTYVAVDGGMSDNPRPVLYGSGYEAFLPRAPMSERPLQARVVGKHCETGDVVVGDGRLPADVVVGDVLATPVTGAYGYSMASNYNKVPRPAVVFVSDGRARVVVRRETLHDLLRLDD